MFAIILLFIFGLVVLGGLATAFLGANEIRAGGIVAAVLGVVLFVLTWVISSVFYVDAREVAIIHEFGKSTGTATTGPRWDTPWSEVSKFSTANQPLDFDGENDRIKFNLAGSDNTSEGEAWVNLNASWQITGDETAKTLWADRKEFERVRNEVALPNIKSAIIGVMGHYNAQKANDSANVPEFNKVLFDEVNKSVNHLGIKVEGIAVTRIDLSDAVKAKLDQKNADKIQNDRAVIQQQTAKTEAETNRIKKQELSELVVQNNCLELTNNWNVTKNGPLPAGWNCMAGVPFTK